MSFSLDNITLPTEDLNKPAEGMQPDKEVVPEKNEEVKPQENSDGTTTPTPEPEKETKPEENKGDAETKPTESGDTTQAQEETPAWKPEDGFHKHPDWIKMQERVEAAEQRAAAAEENSRKPQTPTPTPEPEDPLAALPPSQRAEQRIREEAKKKADEGKPFADEAAVTARYIEILDEEKAKEQKKVEEAQSEAQKRAGEQIQEIYTSLGVTAEEERNKVAQHVLELAKKGENVGFGTIIKTVQDMRQKGELSVPGQTPTPAPQSNPNENNTPSAEDKAKADKEAKDKANRRTSKGSSSGASAQNGKKDKPSAEYLRTHTLDDIVAIASQNLE